MSQTSGSRHYINMGELKPSTGDCELLRAAREDAEAFGEFYGRHAVAVERWIRRQTPDFATAADLTAETFAQALVGLERFRGTTDEAARAWLFGIARNLLRRYRRRGCVELATVRKLGLVLDHEVDELDRAEREIDAAAHAAELAVAVQSLPDGQRQALQLRVVNELGYDQAAILMGTSEQNARARVSRALKTLSQRLPGVSR